MQILAFILAGLWIVVQISGVQTVACATDDDCEATVFILKECDPGNGQCKCKDDYQPTNEGCASRIPKPVVETTNGHVAEATEGATVTLECLGTSDTDTYDWYNDKVELQDENSRFITFTMANTDVAYSCVEKPLTTNLDQLTSEKSEELVVTLISNQVPSVAKLVANLPSNFVALGKSFMPNCSGNPYGVDTKVTVNGVEVTPEAGILQTDADSTFSCEMDFTSGTGATEDFPELFTGISTAKAVVTSDIQIKRDTAFRLEDAPTLFCDVVPGEKYQIDGFESSITFSWSVKKDGKSEMKQNNATWTFDGEGVFEDALCSISLSGESSQSLPFHTIIIRDEFITEPNIRPNPEYPVDTGKVSLSCQVDNITVPIDEYNVSWTRGGNTLERQFDNTLLLTNLSAHDNHNYTCTVTKNGFSRTSPELEIFLTANLEAPAINALTVYEGGPLELTCGSTEVEETIQFSWTKDEVEIADLDQDSFSVDKVQMADSGLYVCRTTVENLLPVTSPGIQVIIEAAGVKCKQHSDCASSQNSLTGICDTTTQRCVCAEYHIPLMDRCVLNSASAPVMGQFLLIILFTSTPKSLSLFL